MKKGLHFLKDIIWLFDIGMEFAYKIIQICKWEKTSICTQSVKIQNYFTILTRLFYWF